MFLDKRCFDDVLCKMALLVYFESFIYMTFWEKYVKYVWI